MYMELESLKKLKELKLETTTDPERKASKEEVEMLRKKCQDTVDMIHERFEKTYTELEAIRSKFHDETKAGLLALEEKYGREFVEEELNKRMKKTCEELGIEFVPYKSGEY